LARGYFLLLLLVLFPGGFKLDCGAMIPHFANNINNNNKMLAAPVEMGVG
jgi:hypothetical protein